MKHKISSFILCGLLSGAMACESKAVIYLDYAASWPVSEEALNEFVHVSKFNGNSSGFNKHAQKLKEIENDATQIIADKLGVKSDQLFFVNNATMANTIAILGVALKYPGCHFITSKIEHKSVLEAFKALEKKGHKVTYLDVDSEGKINLAKLEQSIGKNTKLITIQSFNSEIGTQQDMSAIGRIAKKYKVLLHSDIAQSFGKYPVDMNALDMASISGYKVGAPKGIAVLYMKNNKLLKLPNGTKPSALIASFAKAVQQFHFDEKKVQNNYNVLCNELKKMGGIYINSTTPSHVLSVSIEGVLLQDIIDALGGQYSFSAGCSCLGAKSSYVMKAVDPKGKRPACTLRISFSGDVSHSVLVSFVEDLKHVVTVLRERLAKEISKDKNIGSK